MNHAHIHEKYSILLFPTELPTIYMLWFCKDINNVGI